MTLATMRSLYTPKKTPKSFGIYYFLMIWISNSLASRTYGSTLARTPRVRRRMTPAPTCQYQTPLHPLPLRQRILVRIPLHEIQNFDRHFDHIRPSIDKAKSYRSPLIIPKGQEFITMVSEHQNNLSEIRSEVTTFTQELAEQLNNRRLTHPVPGENDIPVLFSCPNSSYSFQ